MQKEPIFNLIKRIRPEISDIQQEELFARYGLANEKNVSFGLYQIFTELKCAINADWKWDPTDVLASIGRCVPDFKYEIITSEFDEDSEEWNIKVKINDDIVEFEGEMFDLDDFIENINPVISKICDSQFEAFSTGGDSFFYLLVPNHIILSTDERNLLEN